MMQLLLSCNAALLRKSNACLMMRVFRHPDTSKLVLQRKTGTSSYCAHQQAGLSPRLKPAPSFSHGLSCRHGAHDSVQTRAVRCYSKPYQSVGLVLLDTITTMFWSDFPNICMNIAKTKNNNSTIVVIIKNIQKVTKSYEKLQKVSLSQQFSKKSQSEL